MRTVRDKWSSYIDQQHRYPSGIIGQFIGERMLHQHAPETDWSIGLLKIQPIDDVLEVGFGAGRGLALALQQSTRAHVVGLDLSARMIRVAARRNKAAYQRRQLTLVRGDVAQLPFVHASFDKIMSIHTLYFWADAQAISFQLAELLAPGGRLVVTCATAQTQASGERVYWPLHQHVEALVLAYSSHSHLRATLVFGPDSRQFNNVALVIDKQREEPLTVSAQPPT